VSQHVAGHGEAECCLSCTWDGPPSGRLSSVSSEPFSAFTNLRPRGPGLTAVRAVPRAFRVRPLTSRRCRAAHCLQHEYQLPWPSSTRGVNMRSRHLIWCLLLGACADPWTIARLETAKGDFRARVENTRMMVQFDLGKAGWP
jgi:hypothetical protein